MGPCVRGAEPIQVFSGCEGLCGGVRSVVSQGIRHSHVGLVLPVWRSVLYPCVPVDHA